MSGIELNRAGLGAGKICFKVNGEQMSCDTDMTIAQLIEQMSLAQKRVAVELNQEIVPRSRHNNVLLQDGDVVEVVTAIGGG